MVFLDYAATAGEVVDLMNLGLGGTRPLQVTDISLVENQDGFPYQVVLRFSSRAGRLYAVDRAEAPDGTWTELLTGIEGQVDATEFRATTLTDPLPGKLFYRVRILAP
jgi:hypothetical protein